MIRKTKRGVVTADASMMRTSTQAVSVPKTMRPVLLNNHTTMPAGKVVPLAFHGMFREDEVQNGRFVFGVKMSETEKMLMNPVRVSIKVHLVPWLAHPQFNGMDDFNMSYKGTAPIGESVIPFHSSFVVGASNPILDYAGEPYKEGDTLSSNFIEAYNLIWNHRAENRSSDIELRDLDDTSLAYAFRPSEQYSHFVSDWDEAAADGVVPINVISSLLPVQGLGISAGLSSSSQTLRESDGTTRTYDARATSSSGTHLEMKDGYPAVFAELQDNGLTFSLADINSARMVAKLAEIRRRYEAQGQPQAIDDEYVKDLLMSGIRVQDLPMRQPILLAQEITSIRMNEMPATDGASLGESATNGSAIVDISFRTPPINTGGTIVITAEVLPEQTHERQQNPFLYITDTEEYPNFERDIADPQKVEIIKNKFMDVHHTDPETEFAYAPKHSRFIFKGSRVGGYMKRDAGSPIDEDRMHLWVDDVLDMALNEDFYLAKNIHQEVFLDTEKDPFITYMDGGIIFRGNTQFGPRLIEADENYAAVQEKVDQERISPDD